MTKEDAIKEIRDMLNRDIAEYGEFESEYICEAVEMAIEALQERQTGKWVITARNGVLCSECKSGTRKMPMLFGNPLYKFCPFCGAKMEGSE